MTLPIAIAVVSWNTRDLLDACLASLRPDAEAGLAEVWVVDNGSTDGSPELVRERHPWVRLEQPGENLGYGRAVNLVGERTASDWVVASNADIEVTPGALRALLQAGEQDPSVAAVGPRLILPDGSTQASVQPYPSVGQALLAASHVHRVSRRAAARQLFGSTWDADSAAAAPWITGAFLVLRRDAFEAVGGFDAGQWMYAEDLDLCWRLRRAGWEIRYEPSAVVRHHESAASRQAFGHDGVAEQWVAATYAWMLRRHGLARTWAAAGLRFAEARLRLAALGVLCRRDADRWVPRRDAARADVAAARMGLRRRSALLEAR
jgi:GT2 family glycosyltransferase